MSSSATSFTRAATLRPAAPASPRTRVSSVVFPAPRNPETTISGHGPRGARPGGRCGPPARGIPPSPPRASPSGRRTPRPGGRLRRHVHRHALHLAAAHPPAHPPPRWSRSCTCSGLPQLHTLRGPPQTPAPRPRSWRPLSAGLRGVLPARRCSWRKLRGREVLPPSGVNSFRFHFHERPAPGLRPPGGSGTASTPRRPSSSCGSLNSASRRSFSLRTSSACSSSTAWNSLACSCTSASSWRACAFICPWRSPMAHRRTTWQTEDRDPRDPQPHPGDRVPFAACREQQQPSSRSPSAFRLPPPSRCPQNCQRRAASPLADPPGSVWRALAGDVGAAPQEECRYISM